MKRTTKLKFSTISCSAGSFTCGYFRLHVDYLQTAFKGFTLQRACLSGCSSALITRAKNKIWTCCAFQSQMYTVGFFPFSTICAPKQMPKKHFWPTFREQCRSVLQELGDFPSSLNSLWGNSIEMARCSYNKSSW